MSSGIVRWFYLKQLMATNFGFPPAAEPQRIRPAGCKTVFIGNIPEVTRDADIHKLFQSSGRIKDIRWLVEKGTSKFKGKFRNTLKTSLNFLLLAPLLTNEFLEQISFILTFEICGGICFDGIDTFRPM